MAWVLDRTRVDSRAISRAIFLAMRIRPQYSCPLFDYPPPPLKRGRHWWKPPYVASVLHWGQGAQDLGQLIKLSTEIFLKCDSCIVSQCHNVVLGLRPFESRPSCLIWAPIFIHYCRCFSTNTFWARRVIKQLVIHCARAITSCSSIFYGSGIKWDMTCVCFFTDPLVIENYECPFIIFNNLCDFFWFPDPKDAFILCKVERACRDQHIDWNTLE